MMKGSDMMEYQWMEIQPSAPITKTSPIEFHISNTGQFMLDMKKTRIAVKIKVNNTKLNGPVSSTSVEKYATPVNLTLQSLFDQVGIYWQNVLVSRTDNYPYKAMFDVLLNTSREEAESIMGTQLFYTDTEGAMEVIDPFSAPVNVGLYERDARSKNGQIIDLVGPLYVDVLHQNNLLPDKVNLRIKLSQTNNDFRLMSNNTEASLEIIDAKLWVYFAKFKNTIPLPISYNFMQSEMYAHTLSVGNQSLRLDNIYQGRIPSRIIMALVSTKAMVGDMSKNPFNFQHFNVNYLDVIVNGKSLPLDRPLEPDFEKGQCSMAYYTLFDNGCPCIITPKKFQNGYTMYQFFPTTIKEGGNVRIELHFAKPLTETVTLIIYASFPKTYKIDASRSVL